MNDYNTELHLPSMALEFATTCHTGQFRKYTGYPYIFHPIRVAGLVCNYGPTLEMIAAAYLHDVIEDCYITEATIYHAFGPEVRDLVVGLTNVKLQCVNRKRQKQIDRERLSRQRPEIS